MTWISPPSSIISEFVKMLNVTSRSCGFHLMDIPHLKWSPFEGATVITIDSDFVIKSLRKFLSFSPFNFVYHPEIKNGHFIHKKSVLFIEILEVFLKKKLNNILIFFNKFIICFKKFN